MEQPADAQQIVCVCVSVGLEVLLIALLTMSMGSNICNIWLCSSLWAKMLSIGCAGNNGGTLFRSILEHLTQAMQTTTTVD